MPLIVSSKLDYCNSLLHNLPDNSINRFLCVQNSLARAAVPSYKGYIILLLLSQKYTGYLLRKGLNSKLPLLPTSYYKINNYHIFLICYKLIILQEIFDLLVNSFLHNLLLTLLLIVNLFLMLLLIPGSHYLSVFDILDLYLPSLLNLKLIFSLLNHCFLSGLVTWQIACIAFE